MPQDDDDGMTEFWRDVREARKTKHQEMKEQNTRLLTEAGIAFREVNQGENLLIREPGKPNVDFYPSTGRWRIPQKNQTYSGGAQAFLSWYNKQFI